MKRALTIVIAMLAVVVSAKAYRAAATFIAEQGNCIQVIIDGKVMNNTPKNKVSIVGRPGEHQVNIIIYDNMGNFSEEDIECIQLLSGYKTYYELLEDNSCKELTKVKVEPYYSKKYRNPDFYYNRKFLAGTSNLNLLISGKLA